MSADIMMNWAGHTGLDISILIVLVLLCRRPFVQMFGARAAYALWALPLIRLVLPEIPITLPRPSWLQPVSDLPTEAVTYTNFEAVVTGPISEPVNWQLPVVTIWLGVALIWFAVQLVHQHKYIKNVQADAVPVSPQILRKLNQACKSLNLDMVPKTCISSSSIGPMVAGIFRPIIVLPQNFEKNYNARQQVFALTHELAHIKRGDLWAAFGALVFRACNWPNPLVHYCAVKFRADQEAACDAYVLNMIGGGPQTKQSYAATLIHAAKLATLSPKNSTRTPTNRSVLANPLCLTIYHPLKERLMTLKTSKNNSTIFSRIGVGAFLVAALAATAPITIASAADGPAAEAPKVKTVAKKVIKWVENTDGVETTKHIEVIVEDGVTTAYSIDKDGNKTEIDTSEVEMMDGMNRFDQVRKLLALDDKVMGKHTKFLMDGDKIYVEDGGNSRMIVTHVRKNADGQIVEMANDEMMLAGDGDYSNIIVKRMSKGEDGTVMDIDNDVMVFGGEANHAAAMVGAAQSLLDQAEKMTGGKELSAKARKKINKARKALKEAQEALEAEE